MFEGEICPSKNVQLYGAIKKMKPNILPSNFAQTESDMYTVS